MEYFVFFLGFSSWGSSKDHWRYIDTLSGAATDHKEHCFEEKFNINDGSLKYDRHFYQKRCNNKKDEFFSVTANWAKPPAVLRAGETITLSASAAREKNTHAFFQNCGVDISQDKVDCKCGFVCGGRKIGRAVVHSKDNPATSALEAQFKVPLGSPGDTFALRYCPTSSAYHNPPGYRYIYRYCKDSGAGFSDISGQVMICNHDDNPDDEDAWDMAEMADLTSVLCVYDHIRTGEGSGAIIGFADMCTFEMRPETEIMISTPPEPKGKLEMVWGNILINLKKCFKDGSMDIEMNQAVAGIKGTKLECWDTGDTSRIAVYEGRVEGNGKSNGRKDYPEFGAGDYGDGRGLLRINRSGRISRTSEKKERSRQRNIQQHQRKQCFQQSVKFGRF